NLPTRAAPVRAPSPSPSPSRGPTPPGAAGKMPLMEWERDPDEDDFQAEDDPELDPTEVAEIQVAELESLASQRIRPHIV
ncbi:hypothetical protein HAX54_000397, partial [Datura stramonium]|nr:hypothetical protein [Datura stramonium]